MEEKGAILVCVVIVLWDVVKKFILEKNTDLKENTMAHVKNTIAIERLNDQMAHLVKLPSDVTKLGLIVRELRTKVEFLERRDL